jgi:hypothetical protein
MDKAGAVSPYGSHAPFTFLTYPNGSDQVPDLNSRL